MRPRITNDVSTFERSSPDVIAALDACEANDPRAHELLIGVPCSECYSNDRYAGVIRHVTPSLHTVRISRVHEYPDGIYKGGRGHVALDPNESWEPYATEPQRIPMPSEVYSYSELEPKVYRWSKKHGEYRSGNVRLWIGVADNYRCREI